VPQLEKTKPSPIEALKQVTEAAVLDLISQGGCIDHIYIWQDRSGAKWELVDIVRKKGYLIFWEYDQVRESCKATAEEFDYVGK
jgi:hypothetical protein